MCEEANRALLRAWTVKGREPFVDEVSYVVLADSIDDALAAARKYIPHFHVTGVERDVRLIVRSRSLWQDVWDQVVRGENIEVALGHVIGDCSEEV